MYVSSQIFFVATKVYVIIEIKKLDINKNKQTSTHTCGNGIHTCRGWRPWVLKKIRKYH